MSNSGMKPDFVIVDEIIFTNGRGIMEQQIAIEVWVRKPFFVEAVPVTDENMEIVAAWCGGRINVTKGDDKRYIKVEVKNPMSRRQTTAFAGDWVLKSGLSYKVYKDESFKKVFEETDLTEIPDDDK